LSGKIVYKYIINSQKKCPPSPPPQLFVEYVTENNGIILDLIRTITKNKNYKQMNNTNNNGK